jgi:hypothetical protein
MATINISKQGTIKADTKLQILKNALLMSASSQFQNEQGVAKYLENRGVPKRTFASKSVNRNSFNMEYSFLSSQIQESLPSVAFLITKLR